MRSDLAARSAHAPPQRLLERSDFGEELAATSSQQLLEVHRSGGEYGVDGIACRALQAIALQPVFALQVPDAGFDRGPAFHPSPQRARRSSAPALVHVDHGIARVTFMREINDSGD